MSLVSMEIEVDSALMKDVESLLVEQGFALDQAIRMYLDKCVEVGGIPFDFDPEWLIDDGLPHDREIVKELAGRGLRGNDLLRARKGLHERIRSVEEALGRAELDGSVAEIRAFAKERGLGGMAPEEIDREIREARKHRESKGMTEGAGSRGTLSMEESMAELGITQSDLDAIDFPELDVDLSQSAPIIRFDKPKRKYQRSGKMTLEELADGWTGGRAGEEWGGLMRPEGTRTEPDGEGA